MSVEQKIDALSAKLDLLMKMMASGGAGASVGGVVVEAEDDGSSHPSILAYDSLVSTHVQNYYDACDKITGTQNLGEIAKKAFAALRTVLLATIQCKKPSQGDFQKFSAVVDMIAASGAADKAIDNRSAVFAHQKASFEFLSGLGWIFVAPTPMGHCQAQLESADFYLNKILTSNKGDDKELHRAFVKAIKDTLKEFQAFIKEFHRTGLSWNGKKELSQFGGAAAAAAPAGPKAGPPMGGPPMGPPAGGPPMGPPMSAGPPPGMPPPVAEASAAPAAVGLGAVFASINAGHDSLVSGLKKVTKEMKNKPGQMAVDLPPAPVAPKQPAAAAPAAHARKASAAVVSEPRMFEKQGKWFVEHYVDAQVSLNAEELNQKQNVYIFKCINSVITVPSKCKAICIDGCTKSAVVCEAVVSTIEVVNCKNVGVQVNQSAPAIAIDKSSGIQMHLSASAVAAKPDIVTSNITAVNVVVPGKKEDDDPIELPLPEQFITKFDSAFTVKTSCAESI